MSVTFERMAEVISVAVGEAAGTRSNPESKLRELVAPLWGKDLEQQIDELAAEIWGLDRDELAHLEQQNMARASQQPAKDSSRPYPGRGD